MQPRVVLFVFLICMLLALLCVRLIDFQIVQADEWQALALANREFGSQSPRLRATITDRYGFPLAINDWLYYQLHDPSALFGKTTLVDPVAGRSLLATNAASLVTMTKRWYPLGEVLAPIVGYVGSVTAEDLQKDDDLNPTDQVGRQGLERTFDRQLRGKGGQDTFEISAIGEKQRLLRSTAPMEGLPLATTIDPYLSAVAYEALGESKGAVVVVDVATGEILVQLSKPSYDSNILTDKLADRLAESERRQRVQAMIDNPDQPFFNRAIAGTYPPGSIFKLVTALAALDSGNITPDTEVLDEGILRVGDFSYANWYFTQYGQTDGLISLRKAIARSNDIYFYKAAQAAGPEAIADMARAVGFGKPLGVGLLGEASGLVPDPQWKEATKGERWFLGNTFHYGIGQGDLLVTPIQVAQLIQALLNGGVKCALHLTSSSERNCQNLGLNEDALQLVLAGMEDACTTGGTAYPFFNWNDAVRQPGLNFKEQLANGAVACKTGTAEFGATDERGFKKTHGWFVMGAGVGKILNNQLVARKLSSPSALPQTNLGYQAIAGLGSSQPSEVELGGETATSSGKISLSHYTDKQRWLEALALGGFPDTIAIVVLVESDQQVPYREGSRDAAPVAKKILDWITE